MDCSSICFLQAWDAGVELYACHTQPAAGVSRRETEPVIPAQSILQRPKLANFTRQGRGANRAGSIVVSKNFSAFHDELNALGLVNIAQRIA